MFPPQFREFDITTSSAGIHGVVGGSGPPLLLLHGIPETHLLWRETVEALSEHFTVVATDLRGFGGSDAPSPDDADYSMSALAADQAEVMTELGFDRFFAAGHDRGARCAYRLAIDHPERVERLAVLDIVPTGDAFERADSRFALGYWVWSFLAAPAPVPEQLVTASPEAFVDSMLEQWPAPGFRFPDDVRDAYIAQFADPGRVRAICAQYRAAATDDTERDLSDRGRRPVRCPVLALWSADGPVDQWYEPLEIWRTWADEVEGRAVPGGHFIPEEQPQLVAEEFIRFFGR